MFETVAPRAVWPRRRSLLYETLPLSIAVHAIAAGAFMLATTWQIEFPRYSPKLFAVYSLETIPPPPPPPPPRQADAPEIKAPSVPQPLVAPTFIPDTIPLVEDVRYEPVPAVASDANGVEGGVEGGEIGGVVGGVVGGMVGGLIDAPEPEVIAVQRDAPLPMGAISQDFPAYPEFARTRGWEDELVVRYVIGKDGRIKNIEILTEPSRDEFRRATIDAIRYWRFHPFRGVNGEPKEVIHELTVQFKINRRRSTS